MGAELHQLFDLGFVEAEFGELQVGILDSLVGLTQLLGPALDGRGRVVQFMGKPG